MLRFGPDRDGPPRRVGVGALDWTGSTLPFRELDLNDGIAARVGRGRPKLTGFVGRTGGLLSFPIDLEIFRGEAGVRLTGLPAGIVHRRPDQIDVIILLASQQQFGIHVTSIDQVITR